MRKSSILLLSCALAGAARGQLATTRVELDAAVDVDDETVSGTARLTVRNDGRSPVQDVPILLNRLMRVRGASTVAGAPLPAAASVVTFADEAKHQVLAARLALPAPLAPGAETKVVVAWGGPLVGYTETGSLYIKDHVSREFTLLREDAHAFPAIGEPSWAALRAAPHPGFTFDVTVTVPKGLVVAAGGEAKGSEPRGERVAYRFTSAVPVPFLNIAIAPYEVTDENGLAIYAFREDAAGARRLRERVGRALALLAEWLGPPAGAPRLTLFEIPDGWGSQAHLVAGVMQTAAAFRDAERLEETYHELTHLWNPRDLDAPSPRWNEGLATWLQKVLSDALDGGARVADAKSRFAARVLDPAADARLAKVPLVDFGKERMTDASYTVGFLWLATLESAFGRERLLAALRETLQPTLKDGITTARLTAGLEARLGGAARAIDADFVTTPRWREKLRAAGSVNGLAASYAKGEPARP